MCFAWCLYRWVALPMSAASTKHLPPILCIGNRPALTHRPSVLLDMPKCLQTTLAGISRLPIADCITACFSASVIVARWSNAALTAMAAMSSMSICRSLLLKSSNKYDNSITLLICFTKIRKMKNQGKCLNKKSVQYGAWVPKMGGCRGKAFLTHFAHEGTIVI